MSSELRLPAGGRIDRSRPVSFRFNGRRFTGFAGDTIASALLATGVRLVGRSFRLHRPRGVFGSGWDEPNALVHVRSGPYEEPNVRATAMLLRPEMEVLSQNAWPSLRWDVGVVFDWLPKLWPAGFYHKTFMWPSWHFYEPVIRRAAGIGRIRQPSAAVGTYIQMDLETDVLVCGGGPAGIAAAAEAARGGLSVTLVHADSSLGGRSGSIDLLSAGLADVNVLTHTMAVGVFGEKVILAVEDRAWGPSGPLRCLHRIRARSIVVATGALEQPLIFEGNDRPGVMLAGAVDRFLERYAVRCGRSAVLIVNNDAPYRYLECWRASGIALRAIVDFRPNPGTVAETAAASLQVPLFAAPRVLSVRGRDAVRGLKIQDSQGHRHEVECDLVASSGGWVPNVHLFSQARGELQYNRALHAYVPAVARMPGVYIAGAAAGAFDRDTVREHSLSVGRAVDSYVKHGIETELSAPAERRSTLGPVRVGGRPHRQWLDYQHDVTVADAIAAVAQGFTHVEHFKRFTTTGMAIDQGKTSLRNSLDQLAQHSGRSLSDLKPPTYRPPYSALSLAAAAGPNVGNCYRPERRMPCHAEHEILHAHFDDAGGWRRPLHYASTPTPWDCTKAEIHAVRNGAGIFEASPLGKLEVSGPDALEFLNRMYVNNLQSLEVGRVRYVLMLRDNGTVLDDGTVGRIDSDEFLVTTTSTNTERVYLWMREWAECQWPQLRVFITPVTTAWGTVTVSGPKARSIVERVGTDVDLSSGSFPHMSLRLGRVGSVSARIYRVSFTGELSYEINAPAQQTAALWKEVCAAGASESARAYGLDALNVMRIEKGYLHVGADTDSTTTPLDVGWRAIIERKRTDFVGRGALVLPEYQRADRLQLVGMVPVDQGAALKAGAHLISGLGSRSEGYVTSACASPTLGHSVALARLEGGSQRIGEQLLAYDQGSTTAVRIVGQTFYDPGNLRLQG